MTHGVYAFRSPAWFRERRGWLLAQSDEVILAIAHKLRVPYKLKKIDRYDSPRDPSLHQESVAEHKWALNYLSTYFAPLEFPDGDLDVLFVKDIIQFHDYGEIIVGDKPYHQKSQADSDAERVLGEQVFVAWLEEISGYARYCWVEYQEQATKEGRFTHALDKIEPLFELLDPVNETSMKRLEFTFEHHIGIKREVTKNFPVLRRFVDVVSADMLRRSVFWDQSDQHAKGAP